MMQVPSFNIHPFFLREIEHEDCSDWFSYLCNPLVTSLTSYNIETLNDVELILAEYASSRKDNSAVRWAIAEKVNNKLIGQASFYIWNESQYFAELGFDLAPEYWNRSVMTRAASTVIRWAFEHPRINRIQAVVNIQNSRSLHVLSKLGFRIERSLPAYRICAGHAADYFMLGLTESCFSSPSHWL